MPRRTGYGSRQEAAFLAAVMVAVLNAATGAVTATSTVGDEITSAVPAGRRIIAARGSHLVDVTASRAVVLASFPGQVSGLHPDAGSGVDLVAQAGHGSAAIWSWSGSANIRRLGTGPATAVRLFGGLGGRNLASGVTAPAPGIGIARLHQERAFGWMDVPQLDPQGNPEYNGTFNWASMARSPASNCALGAWVETSATSPSPTPSPTAAEPGPPEPTTTSTQQRRLPGA